MSEQAQGAREAQAQVWIFSVRCLHEGDASERLMMPRLAVVGPARSSTVEAALHLAGASQEVRSAIRGCDLVRNFVEDLLDPAHWGYYATEVCWTVSIGSVHAVLPR